jgi:hypothetical protein
MLFDNSTSFLMSHWHIDSSCNASFFLFVFIWEIYKTYVYCLFISCAKHLPWLIDCCRRIRLPWFFIYVHCQQVNVFRWTRVNHMNITINNFFVPFPIDVNRTRWILVVINSDRSVRTTIMMFNEKLNNNIEKQNDASITNVSNEKIIDLVWG